MAKYQKKQREYVHTGQYEVTNYIKDGPTTHGASTRIYDTLEEAIVGMQVCQQDSRSFRVSLSPRMARVRYIRFGDNDRCKTCTSPYRELTEAQLLAGHSTLCVSWHLRRLNWPTTPFSLATHWHHHMVMFKRPSWGPEPVAFSGPGTTPRATPRRFPDQGRWLYTPYPPALPVSASEQSLVLIRGISGSGKTELARTYGLTHRHLEADAFFLTVDGWLYFSKPAIKVAHEWCETRAQVFLSQGESVVVSNTFCTHGELFPYLAMAKTYQIPIHVIDVRPYDDEGHLYPRPHGRIVGQSRGAPSKILRQQTQDWEDFATPPDLLGGLFVYTQTQPSLERQSVPDLPYLCQPGTCDLGPQ